MTPYDQKTCTDNDSGRKYVLTCSEEGFVEQADCPNGDCSKARLPVLTDRPCDGIEKECDCQCEDF